MSFADRHPFPLLLHVDWHPTHAMRHLVSWCCQGCCAMRGHETVFRFEPTRLSLVCLRCGMQTPGWEIDVRPSFRSFVGRRAIAPPLRTRLVQPLAPTTEGQGMPELPHSSRAA